MVNSARVNDSLVRDERGLAAAARGRAAQAGATAADLQAGDVMRDSAEALVRGENMVGGNCIGFNAARTRGRESLTEEAIRQHYAGPLIFADDNECWGL